MPSTPMCGKSGRRRQAFTLLELLIVVTILGIVAAIIVPRYVVSAGEAKRNACAHNVANIDTQVERWRAEKGAWPLDDLSDIARDTNYFPEGLPACPVDGAVYVLDPVVKRVAAHDH